MQALGEGSKGKVSVVGTAIVDIGALASIGSTKQAADKFAGDMYYWWF